MGGGLRSRWASLMRYAIVLAAIAWLGYRTDWVGFKRVLIQANWKLAALAVLVFVPAPVLISIRLKWLLAVNKITLSIWDAIKVTFAGNFIINSLPVGTPGGDAMKAYYVARDTPHKHEAVTVVFFDRVIGVVGLVLMSGIAVLLNWHNPAFASGGRTIGIMFVLLLVGAGVFYSHQARRLLRLDQLIAALPFGGHLQRIDRAAFAFRHRKRRLLGCMILTALLQGVAILSMFVAGWALGMVGDHPLEAFPVYLAFMPMCFLAGALPLGVMEAASTQLFYDAAHLGTPESAIALSLMGRLIQLIVSLPGALFVLQVRPPREAEEAR